jgi:uncharacterized membrane protein
MLLLIVGCVLFFSVHLVPTQRELRAGFVARFGETPYRIAFSVISAIGLALIVIGYGKLQGLASKNPELWSPPVWSRHLAFVLMVPSLVLLAAAYIPSRIRALVGHPMLTAVKIWAFAHLLANGDLASLVLFGSFLSYAVFDRISVKRREAAAGPRPGPTPPLWGDLLAVAIGLAAYALLMLGGHARLIGVTLVPG